MNEISKDRATSYSDEEKLLGELSREQLKDIIIIHKGRIELMKKLLHVQSQIIFVWIPRALEFAGMYYLATITWEYLSKVNFS